MDSFNRRFKILQKLCQRRKDTSVNLAEEFNVSEKTIQRDIFELIRVAPIYTEFGYGGGIFVTDTYKMDRMYMENYELEVLNKLLMKELDNSESILSEKEKDILRRLISDYTKPVAEEKRKKRAGKS